MKQLKRVLLRIWCWITGRERILANGSHIHPSGIVQPIQSIRKERGTRARIRKAIVESRPPKPPKKRQRDIDHERYEAIKARRA